MNIITGIVHEETLTTSKREIWACINPRFSRHTGWTIKRGIIFVILLVVDFVHYIIFQQKQKINKINFKLLWYRPPCTRSSKQDTNTDLYSSKQYLILSYFKQMYFHQEDFFFKLKHFLYWPPCTRSSKQDPNHLKYVWNASFKT